MPVSSAPGRQPRPWGDNYWVTAVFDALRDNGEEPMRITTLVNVVARQGNYSRRADYDRRRVELFGVISKLLRTGRLDRAGRKHVIIPMSDARRQAYLATASQPLDLPPPQV
jgi:hypothetical protein